MKPYCGILIAIVSVLIASMIGCSGSDETSEGPEEHLATANPVTVDAGDEESAVQLALTDTYDSIRAGAHLILNYDAATNSFKGTVKNTTDAILPQVRVEIHLSKGDATTAELGPTTPIDLAPGEQIPIVLMAEGPPFDMWTAHPEVGPMSGGSGEGGAEGPEAGAEGGEHGQGADGEGPEGGGN